MELKEKYIDLREDHIAIFDNFVDEKLIDELIAYFHQNENLGRVHDRYQGGKNGHPRHIKDDLATLPAFALKDHFAEIFFRDIYPHYTKKYSSLHTMSYHTIYEQKLQKTKPGQGYHVWHFEKDGMQNRNRILAYILYLNDVSEGGETEFLYQKCRIQPKRNRFILWPSSFTHTHRGNPPLKEDKYILAGWVEFGIQP
jgi:hypothetical protein